MLELRGDAGGVALHPEQHPRQNTNREQHGEAFERLEDSSVELTGGDLEPGTHSEREGCRRGHTVPNLAEVALLINPPQVTKKYSHDRSEEHTSELQSRFDL